MTLTIAKRLVSRPVPATFTSIPRTPRFALQPFARPYAATPQASPGQSGNVQESKSSSPQEGAVKSSRATDSATSPDTASTQSPISEPTAGQGQDEEGTDPVKQDPKKPAGEKAKETEKQGQTPLDPADK